MMADAALLAAIQLARTPQVGPVSWQQLVARFGSAAAAVAALPDLAGRGGGSLRPASRDAAEQEIAAVAGLGGRHLVRGAADYPSLLAALEAPPPVLIVRGDTAIAGRQAVAMVGARNASALACKFARNLAADLGDGGTIIVSGLARGIDTAAHLGAMRGGERRGATVAVIACGLDHAFPPENQELQDRIGIDHLLVTAYPPGTPPAARQFPARNQIIAGLTAATVVVEAAPRSGSLITARCAADYGREVMAVPGSPLDPRAQGCNQLIRDGATLIQSAADVREILLPLDARMVAPPAPPYVASAPLPPLPPLDADDRDRRRVRDLLGPGPVAVDELVRQSGLAPPVVQLILLELELAGQLARHAGGRVARA